jgi:hypothetical protein
MSSLKEYNRMIKNAYVSYKSSAKARKISFDLSIKDFRRFAMLNCVYCGDKVKTIGIDRIDNDKGYSVNNCAPCCSVCNRMKLASSYEDFIDKCRKITANSFNNKKMFDNV